MSLWWPIGFFLTSSSGSASVWKITLCTSADPAVTPWPWPCATQAWGADTAVSVRRTACLRSTWTAACRRSEVHMEATTPSRRSKVKRRRNMKRKRGGGRKGRITTMILWWEKTLTLRCDSKRIKHTDTIVHTLLNCFNSYNVYHVQHLTLTKLCCDPSTTLLKFTQKLQIWPHEKVRVRFLCWCCNIWCFVSPT